MIEKEPKIEMHELFLRVSSDGMLPSMDPRVEKVANEMETIEAPTDHIRHELEVADSKFIENGVEKILGEAGI